MSLLRFLRLKHGNINCYLIFLVGMPNHILDNSLLAQPTEALVIVRPSALMRAEPTLKSSVLAELPFGTKVGVDSSYGPSVLLFGTNGYWEKIKYKNQMGWIFSRLLSTGASGDLRVYNGQLINAKWQIENLPILGGDQFYAISPKGLVLRSEPSLAGRTIAKIPYGDKVTKSELPATESTPFEGITAPWFLVEFKGKKGYVWSGFLSQLPPPPTGCEDMEHYLLTRLKPESAVSIKQLEKTSWLRERTYSPALQFKLKYGVHSWTQSLTVPSASDASLFLLFRICATELNNIATQAKDGGYYACYTEGGDNNSIPSGFTSLTVKNAGASSVEIILTNKAHERCPKP